ncbi:patatin-like phospholipase family protein [Enterobacter asburiae]|uniref:patatin-like phospholipase family protein n=1 Tax=Enterobacter asburiae TaxID=61645 RepID=UPI002004B3EF|nr:patatin-like phospholipase family protein [Enterobacter asburiae]MCK7420317.1 patatin-like phospholipase family protein [Enterobacter asburiae]HDY8739707.1 patatin-like phospholipase family protein [Klebsiella pneumoniae]
MTVKINAYAVFDGGGIKGLAFTGALKAMEKSNIEIIGYAGASSGAMIAYLSSIGYTGEEIYEQLNKTDFISLLNQPEKDELNIIKNVIKARFNVGWVGEKANFFSKLLKLRKIDKCVSKEHSNIFDRALKRLVNNFGLYNKDGLEDLLKRLTLLKITTNSAEKKISDCFLSFSEHYKLTKKDLRIIATCLDDGNALEFSHLKTPDECVIKALLASGSYPIVFQPSNFNGRFIVDGGLSCNLPTYTFYNDSFKRYPIFAFDLVPLPIKFNAYNPNTKINTLFSYIGSMINASLDASTNIISKVTGGVAITIRLPRDIKATDFDLEETRKDNLFLRGERYTRFIINHSLLTSHLKDVKTKHDIAKLLYGKHEIILSSLITALPKRTETVKAWLYTTIDKPETELVSFAKGSNNPLSATVKDLTFSLKNPKIFSCTESWDTKKMFPIYDSRKNKTYINYPIKVTNELFKKTIHSPNAEYIELLAILVISIDCHFTKCNWFTLKTDISSQNSPTVIGLDISPNIDIILEKFEKVIRNAILGHQMLFHENRGGIKNA